MEAVIVISIAMIWIVAIVLLVLTSFGYGLKSRGFAKEHSAIAALPMSGIDVKEYRSKKDDHPVVDDDLAKKSVMCKYASYIAVILLIVFLVLALFL